MNDFVKFLNKKKNKTIEIIEAKKKVEEKNKTDEKNDSIKDFLNNLNTTSQVKKKNNEDNKKSNKEISNKSIETNKINNTNKINETNENNDSYENKELYNCTKQYYKYINSKGIKKEVPILMKKKLEDLKKMEENLKFKVKKFSTTTQKSNIEHFFKNILEENLVEVKLIKNDSQFTGEIILECKNNDDSKNILLNKKYYYDNSKLKIKPYS